MSWRILSIFYNNNNLISDQNLYLYMIIYMLYNQGNKVITAYLCRQGSLTFSWATHRYNHCGTYAHKIVSWPHLLFSAKLGILCILIIIKILITAVLVGSISNFSDSFKLFRVKTSLFFWSSIIRIIFSIRVPRLWRTISIVLIRRLYLRTKMKVIASCINVDVDKIWEIFEHIWHHIELITMIKK